MRLGFLDFLGIVDRVCFGLGHRNYNAIYLKGLELSIGIQTCGCMKINSINSASSARFWPLLRGDNSDALVSG
jgi:hypothetical protein